MKRLFGAWYCASTTYDDHGIETLVPRHTFRSLCFAFDTTTWDFAEPLLRSNVWFDWVLLLCPADRSYLSCDSFLSHQDAYVLLYTFLVAQKLTM